MTALYLVPANSTEMTYMVNTNEMLFVRCVYARTHYTKSMLRPAEGGALSDAMTLNKNIYKPVDLEAIGSNERLHKFDP